MESKSEEVLEKKDENLQKEILEEKDERTPEEMLGEKIKKSEYISTKKNKSERFKRTKALLNLLFVQLLIAIIKILMLGLAIYIIGKIVSSNNRLPALPSRIFVEMDMSKKLSENKFEIPFDIHSQTNFYSLIENMNTMIEDNRVKGLVLKVDDLDLDRAQIEEFNIKLDEFKKAGKKIYSYALSLNNKNYLIAMKSDTIIMPDTTWAESYLTGYHGTYPYFKKLGDKIGVEATVINIGSYKSYGESYTQEKMSKELRENSTRILDKIYNNFVDEISLNRNLEKKIINEKLLNGELVLASPKKLQEYKLIDETIYYDDFFQNIELRELMSSEDYLERRSKEEIPTIKEKDKIAIIYLDGVIAYEGNVLKQEIISPNVVIDKLNAAEKLDDVKGVVLRINSPGGSALAADLMYNAVRKMKKPVYVSMGGVAASGGYYIASSSDKIYADKSTLTGSIGVVSIIPNIEKLMDKLGIEFSEITKGKYANLYNITTTLTEGEKKKLYDASLEGYNEFLAKVATGRKMNIQEVAKVAEGRVWLGEEAKEIGLVDEIGGIEKAIKDMATFLNLENYQVIESLEAKTWKDMLKEILPKNYFSNVNLDINVKKIIEKEVLPIELYGKPIVYERNLEIYY